MEEAMKTFYSLREIDEFRKKPSTSELIDWLKALITCDVSPENVSREIPFAGALLKKEVDYDYFINNYLTRNGNTVRRR
jgi:MoxR-like ATPase